VLLDESKTYILPRLRAELASSGFRLVLVPPTARRPDRRDLERLAAEQDAAGGLSFFKDQQGPEVWAVDPASGKTIFRDVILGLESHDDPAGAISIRVVETLRATLLQVEHREPVRAPPPPSVEAAPAAPPRLAPADRFALRLAGGVGYSPGGVGTTDHVGISFAWKTGPRWRMALDGSLTPARLRLDGPEGEARIGLYCVGLSSGFELLAPRGPVRLRSGAGVWLGIVTMNGNAKTGYFNDRATLVSALPHVDMSFEIILSRRFSAGFGVSAAVDLPGATVQFGNRQVATWGRPFFLGLLGVESLLD